MYAKDIMTSPVLSVSPESPILEAIRIMLQRHISGLPVIDKDEHLVGMLTEGDLLRRAETETQRRRPRWLEFLVGPGRLAEEYSRSHGRKIHEVMSGAPIAISEDTPLDEIVRLMEKQRIKRVPVVRADKVIGIVSRANLIHALAGVARNMEPAARSDQEIREKLLGELAQQPWAPTALMNVIVKDGIVELWGAVTDERERQAIVIAAENLAGVREVRDHMVWVDPSSGMAFYSPADDAVQAKTANVISNVRAAARSGNQPAL
jgi:CBS domain-containing protein